MMDIETLKTKKILGYVEYFMQEKKHAELVPLAYYDKNEKCYVKLQEAEIKLFTPFGKVFYPGIEYIGCSKENTLIEFSFKQAKEKGKDDYIVDYGEIKETLRRLKYIAPLESIHENYFSLDELKNTSEIFKEDEIDFRFYFAIRRANDEVWVYGAFKSENNRIVPEVGTEVIKYRFPKEQLDNISLKTGNEARYLLDSLNEYESEDSVDCSTHKQLNDWFKEEFSKTFNFSDTDIAICRKMIAAIEDTKTYADQIRFIRVKNQIENLEWTREEIENLLKSNSSIMNDLIEQYERDKSIYLQEALKDLELIQEEKNNEIIEKEKQVKLLEKCISDKTEKNKILDEEIKLKTNDLKEVEKNFDNILLNLKTSLPILSQNSNSKMVEPEYEVFEKTGMTYTELDEEGLGYEYLFRKNCGIKIEDSVIQNFECAKALFIPNIAWAYIYSKGIQNSKLFTMHIEHDWLHFSDYEGHGLLSFWKDCWADSETNFILVLDSINITQPECGLKPLLDVINNARPTLTETKLGFPKNLKIFATVVSQENNVGLSFSPTMFASWGALDIDLEVTTLPQNYSLNDSSKGYFTPLELLSNLKNLSTDEIEEKKKKYYDY